jgi:hypothetical protein
VSSLSCFAKPPVSAFKVADYVQSRGCIYREASEQDCFVLIMIGLRCEILPTQDDDPEMNYNANETLNRLFARAIYLWNGLQDEAATDDEDLRKSFLAAWEPLMNRWEAAYPSRSESFLGVFSASRSFHGLVNASRLFHDRTWAQHAPNAHALRATI